MAKTATTKTVATTTRKKVAKTATKKVANTATTKVATTKKTKVATKKVASRATTAKVSPLRGMPIDQWLATKTSGWQREVVRTLLELIGAAVPGSTVSIKWSQPVFELHGPFAFVRPAKAHVSLGFWRGNEVADPSGKLERGNTMGHFKIRSVAELDVPAVTAMVKDAARLNAAKGDPTR